MDNAVRVRFAPSPTGALHIGGARVALFNFLYARHCGGTFLLRIEDTDTERSEARFTDDIMASLRWLGLAWDEEPLYQHQRSSLYREAMAKMLADGNAYYCTCTEVEVEAMRVRAQAEGRKPEYDRTCRSKPNIVPDVPYVIRAKIPREGGTEFHDLIRGTITVANSEIDDFVLQRSQGGVTYNLSVVVDDNASQITHVLRGEDHMSNTPKQLHLYSFLGYPPPQFAHLPMVLGADKKKLSKRFGAVSTSTYRQDGILPEALNNFLVRLGWSHGDQEFFTMDELVRVFSLEKVQKSGAVLNPEKLLWLNGEHMRQVSSERLKLLLEEAGFAHPLHDWCMKIAAFCVKRAKTLHDLMHELEPICSPPLYDLNVMKHPPARWPAIADAVECFSGQLYADVTAAQIEEFVRSSSVSVAELAQPLRLCVTGKPSSSDLFDILALMPLPFLQIRLAHLIASLRQSR